jgi:hypothetical protein
VASPQFRAKFSVRNVQTIRIEKKRLKKLENATDPRWLWVEEHRCYLCGEPAIEGHKLCQKHYDESCKGLEKARSVAKEAKIGLHAPFTFGGGKA